MLTLTIQTLHLMADLDEVEFCDLEKLRPFRQTIQLVDSGDGFTEMVPPEPEIRHIWPSEKASLFYLFSRPTIKNKVWIYETMKGETYRLEAKIDNFPCFELGVKEVREPFEHRFYLKTSLGGIYMFAEYDTNWKLLKNLETHQGRNEIYTPLKTFVVLELKPAKIGLTLRLGTYEPFENCAGAQTRLVWLMNSLQNLRVSSSMRKDLAMLDGKISHKILREQCRRLSDDASPTYVATYYSIDRARITPSGAHLGTERPWSVKGIPMRGIRVDGSTSIPLPQPFGAVTRIRLEGISLSGRDEFNLTLMTRSEEAMNEVFWGPGNAQLPYPEEQALPYEFAKVRINQSLFHELCPRGTQSIEWMVIEPWYGRIRTSNGVIVAMNVWDSWENARFITELIIDKSGEGRRDMRIEKLAFEQPQDKEEVGEVLRAIHEERPLPGATPKFGRACWTKVHGFATSSYYVHLEQPDRCIKWDEENHRVKKKTESIRSALTSYTVQLLYDDFGDELVNATGTVIGHIQAVTFSRKARRMTDLELDCPRQSTEEGETMRIGFVVDRVKDQIQYISRWEDRWVRYLGETNQVAFVPLSDTTTQRWASTPGYCPPERTTVDFAYSLDTRRLQVVANDTDELILDVTLEKHPIWLGFEVFTDPNATRCVGCFVHVQIDRRGVDINRPMHWPSNDSAVNQWSQVHFPRQANSKAAWYAWVDVTQKFERRVALTPSPKNLQRRLVELTRKLANPNNISVVVAGAAAYCPPGQYMPYGTPAVCVECPPGTQSRILYENTSFPVHVCQQCPKGTYQDIPGQTKCLPCAQGQTTPTRGSWSRGSCGPNVTTDGMFVSHSHSIPMAGKPYVMVELPSKSKEQTYDWTKDEDEDEYQDIEGPGELNMVSTGRLVFNMVSLVLLLGCVMAFAITSKGYMLIWITRKARYRRTISTEQSKSSTTGKTGGSIKKSESSAELSRRVRTLTSDSSLSG